MKTVMSILLILLAGTAASAEYTYWLTDTQPWNNTTTSTTPTSTVQVRSYVPGSNTITYRNMTVVYPNYTTGGNVYGDQVGYVYSIYGTQYRAWVYDYQYGKNSVAFPVTSNYMGTVLSEVSDDRIAVGFYQTTGAVRHAVLYDLVYRTWHEVSPGQFTDINANGQAVGYHWNYNTGKSAFLYTCEGLQNIDLPGATGTTAENITDAGVISGRVSGLAGGQYFVAEPVTPYTPTCALIRDPSTLGDPWAPPRIKSEAELECDYEGGTYMDVQDKGWKCVDDDDLADTIPAGGTAPAPEPDPEPDPDPAPDTGTPDADELAKDIRECEEQGDTWIDGNCEE